MATFTEADDLQGAEFAGVNLHDARFVDSDLTGVVMREVEIRRADIDSPRLFNGEGFLLINGVDVIPLVDAELNRRFPGRGERRATDPEHLRSAWAAVEGTWDATVARVVAMPAEAIDISVDGEWSFAQTLRHLVLATDAWLGKAVLGLEQPFHPIGQPFGGAEPSQLDLSVFQTDVPSFDEVLRVRAGRVAMVRDFLARVTAEQLAENHPSPWAPERERTTLSCLHVILEEEWEHHRYAVRDLDTIAARR